MNAAVADRHSWSPLPMTRRRWIADKVAGNRAVLLGDNAFHLARVLRAKIGQHFDVVADARVRQAIVASVSDKRVEFDLGQEISSPSSLPEITLLLAIFKFDRMEWAIEKATELGVARLLPVIAARTDKHLAIAAGKRAERWRRIAHEAAQQSRRATPPDILAPVDLEKALASCEKGVVLAESEQDVPLKDALVTLKPAAAISLATGPEGGWTSEELRHFRDIGWRQASLGATILRAETAAIAAMAITLSELA